MKNKTPSAPSKRVREVLPETIKPDNISHLAKFFSQENNNRFKACCSPPPPPTPPPRYPTPFNFSAGAGAARGYIIARCHEEQTFAPE